MYPENQSLQLLNLFWICFLSYLFIVTDIRESPVSAISGVNEFKQCSLVSGSIILPTLLQISTLPWARWHVNRFTSTDHEWGYQGALILKVALEIIWPIFQASVCSQQCASENGSGGTACKAPSVFAFGALGWFFSVVFLQRQKLAKFSQIINSYATKWHAISSVHCSVRASWNYRTLLWKGNTILSVAVNFGPLLCVLESK